MTVGSRHVRGLREDGGEIIARISRRGMSARRHDGDDEAEIYECFPDSAPRARSPRSRYHCAMRFRSGLLVLALHLFPTLVVAQQRGDLIVATEQITESAFAQTVILLLHSADDGAVGVAINRPTWVTTTELFPELDETHRYRGPIFHGGPLAQATVLALSASERLAEGDREPIVPGIYMSSNLDLFGALVEDATDDTPLRFYAGHASWGPGQLDEEIGAGAWRTVAASAALIFDADPRSLWRRLAAFADGMSVRERPADAPHPTRARTAEASREAYTSAE